MKTIGERLRAERERLGLTQEKFGRLGGVKKLSQLQYEKGDRPPSGRYLAALRTHGVRTDFIMNGEASVDDDLDYALTTLRFLEARLMYYAYDRQERPIDERAAQQIKRLAGDVERVEMGGDFNLLLLAVLRLETSLLKLGLSLAPEQKAIAVTSLYRAALNAGDVSDKMVNEAIRAAG